MSDALTTKARIKDRLKITETGFDDLFDRLIVATTKRISQMCNRRFLQATYTRELYDGCSVTGGRLSTLIVKNAPVHSITTIEYKTGLNSDPSWTPFDEDDYDVDMAYGILYFKFLLPAGKRNIRITYNAGWSGNSIGIADGWVFNSTPTGTVNGVNLTFTLAEDADQVVVYADGLRVQSANVTHTEGSDQFTLASGQAPYSTIAADYLPTSSSSSEDDTLPEDLVEVCEEVVMDIHFFPKNTEEGSALTDTSGNYIFNSLEIVEDLTQVRNSVLVQGGEAKSDTTRTETFDGDGTKAQFALANKFAELPTVTVDSVAQTVGVEFLDDDASFDCMWNFNEKYLRFTSGNIPASGTNNVEVEGIYLYPIVVSVPAPSSIAQFGTYEFAITDKSIKSQAEAIARAQAELRSYQNTLYEGTFRTYADGFRSGQVTGATSLTIADNTVDEANLKINAPTDDYVLVASSTATGGFEWVATSSPRLGLSAGAGSVTSVAATVPTGWQVSGSPIITSGTLALSYAAGYGAVLTASTTEWAAAHASTTALTPAYIRGLFSNTATGLTYNSSTGATSLTAGYGIPLSASTTEWTNFYNTPSTRITDGTGLTWSVNTLNVDDAYVLNTGDSISGNLTFSGTGANIALGSNYLSGDGDDEGVYVDSSGNVGIGTSTPQNTITVVGTSTANIMMSDRTYVGTTTPIVSADGSSLASLHVVSSSAFPFSVEGTAAFAGMDINGIGATTVPFIQINRGTNRLFTITGATDNDTVNMRAGSAGGSTPSWITLKKSSLFVGIGSTAPVTKLSVGTTTSNTNGETISLYNPDTTISATQGYGRLSWYGEDATAGASGERAYIYGVADTTGTSGETDLAFGTAGAGATLAERLRITSDGKVGIGTTTPGSLLTVAGTAEVTGAATLRSTLNVTGQTTLANASTTNFTASGNVDLSASTNKLPLPRSFTWPGVATTTSATSTVPLGIAMSAEAWNSARCKTTSGTAAWLFKDDAGNRMNGGTASTTSTSTLVTLSTNNTFTTGEGRNIDIGPLTDAMITCSVDVTINN